MSGGLQAKDVHQETPAATYSGFIALIIGIGLLGFAVYLLYGAVTNAAGGRAWIMMPFLYAGAVFVIASLVLAGLYTLQPNEAAISSSSAPTAARRASPGCGRPIRFTRARRSRCVRATSTANG